MYGLFAYENVDNCERSLTENYEKNMYFLPFGTIKMLTDTLFYTDDFD